MSFDPHNERAHWLTVSKSRGQHPQILLEGNWLAFWGFLPSKTLIAFYIRPGQMLARLAMPEMTQEIHLPILRKRKPRTAIIRLSARNHSYYPVVRITEKWTGDWGFDVGDRISVTSIEYGVMEIKREIPAVEWREARKKEAREREEVKALSIVKEYMARYPSISHYLLNLKQKHAS